MRDAMHKGFSVLIGLLLAGGATAAETEPRTLLISLDAVPYRVAAEVTDPSLGENALFAGFKGPVPLVSTFPSSTSVAMVGLLGPLGLEKSPGYEAQFFDWERLEVRGGGPISYNKIRFPWREFFDWSRRTPAGSAVEAIRPVKSGIGRLRDAVDAFVASENDVSLVYIAATDTAVHVVSPEAVKELFEALDSMLIEARRLRPDRPFETVIFSDHGVAGGDPLVNVLKAVKKALKQAGFDPARKLRDPNDVVLTPFGLVSNFELYSRQEHEARVAEAVATVEGVEVCVIQHADAWELVSRQGRATVRRRQLGETVLWRYETSGVDPLGYEQVVRQLSISEPPMEGWVSDDRLFDATRDHEYPDALHRVAGAFELVTNPASVICSLDSGHMYGSQRTDLLAKIGKGRLRWTHGALNREATLGFLMSDAKDWKAPEAARFDRCLLPFQEALSRHPNIRSPAVE